MSFKNYVNLFHKKLKIIIFFINKYLLFIESLTYTVKIYVITSFVLSEIRSYRFCYATNITKIGQCKLILCHSIGYCSRLSVMQPFQWQCAVCYSSIHGLNRRQIGSSVTLIVPFLKLKENLVLVFVFGIALDNVQAHSIVFPSTPTAAECEVTTIQQALQIPLDLGLDRVVFETDCQLIVNAVLGNSSMWMS